MSTGQAAQSGVVEILDEPIVDDNLETGAVDEDTVADSGDAATVEAPKPVGGQLGVSQWIRRIGVRREWGPPDWRCWPLPAWRWRPGCTSSSTVPTSRLVLPRRRRHSPPPPRAASRCSPTPRRIERDLATANSHLTGEFLTYYRQFTDQS
jgi:hypothetical protein